MKTSTLRKKLIAILIVVLCAFQTMNAATLNLKFFIQGYYIGGGMMTPVLHNCNGNPDTTLCDYVTIYLLDPVSPNTVVETLHGSLHTDGTCSVTITSAVIGNSYYIDICHRGTIQTMSASPVTISSVTAYDFSIAASQAYGSNQIDWLNDGVFEFYSGDLDGDCIIESADYLMMENDVFIGVTGCVCSDLNGDGLVDLLDMAILAENVNNIIICQSPGGLPVCNCSSDSCAGFSVDAGPNQIICQGDNATLSANTSGGTPTYFYSWTPLGGPTPFIIVNPTTTTIYTISVTDINGCTATDEVTIVVIPTPAPPVSTNSTQCGYGVPTASVSGGGGLFNWYLSPIGSAQLGGETGSTLTSYFINSTTVFYVSEYDGNCESERVPVTTTVIQADEITATASDPCATPIILTVTQTGSNNSYTYQWTADPTAGSGISGSVSGSVVILPITVTGGHTYIVIGTDANSGCAAIDSVTVLPCAMPDPSCSCLIDPIGNPDFHVVPFSNSDDTISYRNDDGSTDAISLPFNFCFYGPLYNSVYININGNISFDNFFGTYTPTGFPLTGSNSSVKMIAPFWADVDTRNLLSGIVYYRVRPHDLTIVWKGVGYFDTQADKLNHFQLIITDGTSSSLIPSGNNVSFCYGDMSWTTGAASDGVNGFCTATGGAPATVGASNGGANSIQFGRFGQAGTLYSGPFGALPTFYDGVSFLDNQKFLFSTCNTTNNNIAPIYSGICDTIRINCGDTINIPVQFLSPEQGQTTTITYQANNFPGFSVTSNVQGNTASLDAQVIGNGSNLGFHTITLTGTDNGVPPGFTTVNIVVEIIAGPACQCNQCDTINKTPLLVINTGYDESTNQALSDNTQDNRWMVTNAPAWAITTPNPAITLPFAAWAIPPHYAWANPTGLSKWISLFNNSDGYQNNEYPDTPFTFEYEFCLCADDSITFDLDMMNDDSVKVYLNNYQYVFTPFGNSHSVSQHFNGTFYLPKGRNYLRCDLRNLGSGPLGINLAGTMNGSQLLKNGSCNSSFSIVDAGNDTTVCSGSTAELHATGCNGTITWYVLNGGIATQITGATGSQLNVIPTQTTCYKVTCCDSLNCCTSDTVCINVIPCNDTLRITGINFINCRDSICPEIAGGCPPYFYSWSNGTINECISTIGFQPCDVITLTVFDNCGNSVTKTMQVPDITFTTTPSSAPGICDATATVNVNCFGCSPTSTNTYAWNTLPVKTTQTVTGLCCGETYCVTITDCNGQTVTCCVTIPPCDSCSNLTVHVDSILNPCFGLCNGHISAYATGGTPFDINIPHVPYNIFITQIVGTSPISPSQGELADNPFHVYADNLCAGVYLITVTDANGCAATDTITLSEINCCCFGNNIIQNSGFTNGINVSTSTSMGLGATIANWTDAYGTPQIGNSPGCQDSGFILMWGNQAVGEAIQQNLAPTILQGRTYRICFCARWRDTNTPLTSNQYVRFLFRASNAALTNTSTVNVTGVRSVIGTSVNITNTGNWVTYTLPDWTADANYSILTISATNSINVDDGAFISWGDIDNLCISLSPCDSFVADAGPNQDICDGSCATLSTSSIPGVTYNWYLIGNPVPIASGSSTTVCPTVSTCYLLIANNTFGCADTDTVCVNVNNIYLNCVTNIICYGTCNGTITANVLGGTPNYLYSIDGNSYGPSNSFYGLCAGTYQIIVMDANGCTASCSIAIVESDPINFLVNQSDVKCCGGQDGEIHGSTVGGTGPFIFNIIPDPNGASPVSGYNFDFFNLPAGTYSVNATDINGCTSVSYFFITEPPCLQIHVDSLINPCTGLCNGHISAYTSGGTPFNIGNPHVPYDIIISQISGSSPLMMLSLGDLYSNPFHAYADNLCGGVYLITVTDANGCTATDTITLSEADCCNPTILTDCDNGHITLCAQLSGTCCAPPYTYSWSGPNGFSATTSCIDALISGTYTVIIACGLTITYTASIEANPERNGWAVATYFAPQNSLNNNVKLIDVRHNFNTQPKFANTTATMYSHPSWNTQNLTEVFGIAHDNAGNIFVTSSTVYGPANYTVKPAPAYSNGGGVYKLNAVTGSVTPLSFLPNKLNPTPGLGNICYDKFHGQLLVTNFEDGKIYRINPINGTILEAFDPLVLDNGTTGFAPVGERPWGIGVYGTSSGNVIVYYSIWANDLSRHNGIKNSIRCVSLGVNGTFIPGTDQWLFDLDFLEKYCTSQCYSNPVSDIEFSEDGTKMLLAERSMYGELGFPSSAHQARVLEYTGAFTTWSSSTTNLFTVGAYPSCTGSASSTGGVDYGFDSFNNSLPVGCDSTIWAMADAMFPFYCGGTSDYIYGLQQLNATGTTNNILNSVLIDLDGDLTNAPKALYGDVDIFKCCSEEVCDSMEIGDRLWIDSNGDGLQNPGEPDMAVGIPVILHCVSCAQPDVITYTSLGGIYHFNSSNVPGGILPNTNYKIRIGIGFANYVLTQYKASGGTMDAIDNDAIFSSGWYEINYKTGNCPDINNNLDFGFCPSPSSFVVTVVNDNGSGYAGQGQICVDPYSCVSCNYTDTFSYSWSNGATSSCISNLTTGLYTVTVINITTGWVFCPQTVYVDSIPSINLTANCSNGLCATVGGGYPNYTYQWSDPAFGNNSCVSPVVPGTVYTVTVTDANGITATQSITAPTPLDLICFGSTAYCFGGSVSVSVLGGSGLKIITLKKGNVIIGGYGSVLNQSYTFDNLSIGHYCFYVVDANGCTDSCCCEILNGKFTISPNVGNVTCTGLSNGSVGVTVTGTTGPYTYLWSSGATSGTIVNLPVGVYTVTVTDSLGCAVTDSAIVSEPQAMVSTTLSNNVTCNGGSDGTASVTANGGTGPYTYLWSNSSTAQNNSGLTAGTYFVTVTDANGCTASSSISVSQPASIIILDSIISVTCNGGNNGFLSFSASGGTGAFTYSVTRNTGVSCCVSDCGINPDFTCSNCVCSSSSAGPYYNLSAGTYVITVTDANGCSATQSVTLTQPPSFNVGTISGTSSLCAPGPQVINYSVAAVLNATSYQWSVPAGVTISTGQGTTAVNVFISATAVSNGVKGNICVIATGPCGLTPPSCLALDINSVAPVQPNSISGNVKVCPGDVVTYSVAAVTRATSYSWSLPAGMTITSGAGTNVIVATVGGSYTGGTISVAAANACGVGNARSKLLSLNTPLTPGNITGPLGGQCGVTHIVYSIAPVSNASSYLWTITTGTNQGPNTGTSMYYDWRLFDSIATVAVSSVNGCGQSLPRVISVGGKPATPGLITGSVLVCANGTYTYSIGTVSGATSYTWTVPGGTTINSGQGTKIMNMTYGPVAANNLTVSVKASNACGTSSLRLLNGISVVFCPRFGDANSTIGDSHGLDVFPNPAHDELNVLFTAAENDHYLLQLLDITGRVVITETGTGTGDNLHRIFNVNMLSKGLYMVQLITDNGTSQLKVILE